MKQAINCLRMLKLNKNTSCKNDKTVKIKQKVFEI